MTGGASKARLHIPAVLLISLGVYFNTLYNQFVYDDIGPLQGDRGYAPGNPSGV